MKARKNRALLAVLALAASGSMPRRLIASLLWSDRGEGQARYSLRQALVGLRKDLAAADPALLSVSDENVTLDLARLEVDAVAFRRLGASDEVAALRGAAALYRGELLAGITIRDRAFEEWLLSERQRLADMAILVLEKLCAHEIGAARIDVAKRLVALDPLREASHRQLMQVYFEAGERGLALQQYEVCRATLKNELRVGPGPQTEALQQLLVQASVGSQEASIDGKGAATPLRLSRARRAETSLGSRSCRLLHSAANRRLRSLPTD